MEIKDTGIIAEIWPKGKSKCTNGFTSEVFDYDGDLCVWHPFKVQAVILNAYLEDENWEVRLVSANKFYNKPGKEE